MFQLTHKKKPARTVTSALKPKALLQPQVLSQVSGENQSLSLDLEDCEPSVEPEDFGKGGVEVKPEDFGKGGVEVTPEDFEKGGVEVEPEDSGKGGVGSGSRV